MNNTEAEEATNELQNRLRTWLRDVLECTLYKYETNYEFRGISGRKNEQWTVETDEERLRTLEELCQKGANLHHLQNERGLAVIPHVFWSKQLIQFFLDRGMNINSRLENGDTVLHQAICNIPNIKPCKDFDPYDDEINIIKYLLDQSADPNITNLRGETALFGLARRELRTTDHNYRLELVNLFRERGTDFGVRNIDGESLLHVFDPISCGNNLIGEFIEGDIDVKASTQLYSQTPLMVAHRWVKDRSQFRCCCQQLIERGADLNAQDLQGFTALHYAVLNDARECAEYLIKMGADPYARSSTGKYAYNIVDIINYFPFKFGAAPTKLVEIYEMSGAADIMHIIGGFDECIKLWNKALYVCIEFNFQPTQEFLANYQFLLQNSENPAAFEEIFQTGMNTVVRLSETEMSKFWTLLNFAPPHVWYFFEILHFLSEELKRVEEFASFEWADFYTLTQLVSLINAWLSEDDRTMNEVTAERISHVHSISRLVIACFNKLNDATNNCNKVSDRNMKLYINVCYILTSLHFRFADVISQDTFNENKGLLKTLIELDLRDGDSNSLMHLILKQDYLLKITQFYLLYQDEIILTLLDFEFVDLTTRNRMGFEPIQCIYWENYQRRSEILVKMADRGAHVDARHSTLGALTTRKVFEEESPNPLFPYDNLQCACARVLAKSLVPYVNRVPKKMVDFIRLHLED